MEEQINTLLQKRQWALESGGLRKQQQRHRQHHYTARERIDILLDEGSFEEFDMFKVHRCQQFGMADKVYPGDGVITGHGTIDGRPVFVFSQDATVFGGSLSETVAEKICKIMDMALRCGAPLIGLNDSAGARIQEGIESLAGYAEIFQRNVLCSGTIPQLSAILGPCAGGAVYSPALTDASVMVRGSSCMFLTGPKVVKSVMHEDVDAQTLGGADVHGRRSGVVHAVEDSEDAALAWLRRVLAYLPQNYLEAAPVVSIGEGPEQTLGDLEDIVPDDTNQPYDMQQIIAGITDADHTTELQAQWAPNIITALVRFGGRPVGLVANQPWHMAGVLDNEASAKAARFVRFCDAFNLPVVTLVDVPGFMPGSQMEAGGIIRHGAKLLYAYAEATVPKITVTIRKAYGGAYCVMSSKHLRGDINYAWPSAEIAVMGAQGAAEVLYAKQAGQQSDPENFLAAKTKEYQDCFCHPYAAAQRGYVDDVILPEATRLRVIKALHLLAHKQLNNPGKKHGNMPI